MAVEKSWLAVAPQLLTSDGNTLGIVNIADTSGFKVKQLVTIANGAPSTLSVQVQVRRVVSSTQLIVGPNPVSLQPPSRQEGASLLSKRGDISAFTVALGAYIFAAESPKVIIPIPDVVAAVYDQEPTVAIRTVDVDQYGNYYGPNNPMPIIFDGTVEIGEVEIKGSPSGDLLNVNPDGSINVNIVETPVTGQSVKSLYNQVSNVVSGATTTLVSYTVPVGYTAVFEKVSVSGENIARFDILYNSNPFDTKRSWYCDFNVDFDYTTGTSNGLILNSGDTILVQVLHNRPNPGTFNARIQVLEIA